MTVRDAVAVLNKLIIEGHENKDLEFFDIEYYEWTKIKIIDRLNEEGRVTLEYDY